eukprot:194344-Amphidinium_carterae.1
MCLNVWQSLFACASAVPNCEVCRSATPIGVAMARPICLMHWSHVTSLVQLWDEECSAWGEARLLLKPRDHYVVSQIVVEVPCLEEALRCTGPEPCTSHGVRGGSPWIREIANDCGAKTVDGHDPVE